MPDPITKRGFVGIARYPVECPGCASGIILRLGVGHDLRQPFFYVCPTCRAATRGALLWDGGAGTKVEIAAGRLLDSEKDCKHTVSINPEIPALPTATGMDVPGGSPFLTFVQWLGEEQILGFQSATAQIRHLIDSEWGGLTTDDLLSQSRLGPLRRRVNLSAARETGERFVSRMETRPPRSLPL